MKIVHRYAEFILLLLLSFVLFVIGCAENINRLLSFVIELAACFFFLRVIYIGCRSTYWGDDE